MFKLIYLILTICFAINFSSQSENNKPVKSLQVQVTKKAIFNVTIDGVPKGLITIGLFGNAAPKTVKNFAALASKEGYNGLSYKGSTFHRVIPDFMIQGGDITEKDGSGSISIYGKYFDDENFRLNHSEAGLISMANAGKDTNGSQFFITTVVTDWLNGKHIVFGKVLQGMDIVKSIEQLATDGEDKPLTEARIIDSMVIDANEVISLNQ
ncbi:peptidyl-prolyl cis-trans isomerase [Tetranychus urticae]|uniref:Peptidyl-prolyl cis-trans isomerase n=1 Tax=Tetranychus urticae TaxID=32264 RepID=T1KK17_TETUR|nr:peptidyl-prolyl cis-trans isomerase [Tetranychus urticae]